MLFYKYVMFVNFDKWDIDPHVQFYMHAFGQWVIELYNAYFWEFFML